MADPEPERELLALIMERNRFISREQVLHVMKVQAHVIATSGKTAAFADLAVHFKFVSPTDVRYAQSIEAKLQVAPGQRRPLGYYLMEVDLLRPSQILEALEEQAFFGGRLGEILVRNDWVTDADIDRCLALQSTRHQAVPG